MELNLLNPRKSLNSAFRKVKPERREIEQFKQNLLQLLDSRNDAESEEHHKNLVIDFLKKTYYDPDHFVNTKGRTDLVIHNGDKGASSVGVIVETKKPDNRHEMVREGKVNVKAFQELLLYYLRERITNKNTDIKYLIVTNINEWYIFDAHLFDKLFAQNKKLVKQFEDFESHRLSGNNTDFFYGDVAAPAIEDIDQKVNCTWFDFRDYEKALRNDNPKDDNKLIALYKLLSPQHLLKLPFANDSNSLDRRFYSELLHIIGLSETKQGSKKIIERNGEGQRRAGSLLENTIAKLDSLDKINRLDKPSRFGADYQERLFNVGLELVITWINRILFLKLMEAQLVNYHKGDKSYEFLNIDKVHDYDALEDLFFKVLAKPYDQRGHEAILKFEKVPYLNSSLFESAKIENETILLSNLRNEEKIPILSTTVLKDQNGKKRTGELETLEYLFAFLNAYDFSSEGGEEIQEENKTLINASVLGLIFEKINGYKDGAFFTPGFITMYMSRETIRRAVVQKFNETKAWDCKTIDDLYDRIEDRDEANQIINSLKICDPAVGSGHFLVSALNEIIAVKHDLRVLQDRDGRRLKEYDVEVANDELVITDEDGDLFEYRPGNKESQRVQETLFHEKQTIIENCLFGVDINPNSVKICRLRLWIELLKNAYYVQPQVPVTREASNSSPQGGGREGALETLPNIDINIKEGNSLISRFDINADLKKALRKSDGNWTIEGYRSAVATYRNADSKEQKHRMESLIEDIKSNFRSEISLSDPKFRKLQRLKNELNTLTNQGQLFELGKREKAAWSKKVQKLTTDTKKLETEIEEIRNNKIYENAFEWRFEFPEVLDDEGNFVGFDVVIGNPPYFSISKLGNQADFFKVSGYKTYSKGTDIYCLFFERGEQVLKPNGHLTFITSNSWLRSIYGNLLKEYFLQKIRPVELLNIEDIQVFEEATVESNIITLEKGAQNGSFLVTNLSDDYLNTDSLSAYFRNNCFEFEIPESKEWFIGNKEVGVLKRQIEDESKRLGEFNIRINFGIKTGFNEAFIIDEQTKNELIRLDGNNSKIIEPIVRGRDLKKFSFDFSSHWAICTFPSLNIDIEDFPGIKEYFLRIGKNRLEQTGKKGSRKKTGNKWFETQDSIGYWRDFEKPKIIWGEISDKPKFAYDEEGYYAEATTFLMTGERLKFLLAILNSKVSEWYFKLIGTTTGMGTNRWKKYKIELLPIRIPTREQEEAIEKVTNQILSLKKQDPAADTTALEAEIDRLVYELYGLTEEEIRIVEESVG
ncbi:Eco57I restriction-modification methylase domain-containing protein [Marinilabilia salmonicolor]|uniref:site-specific DNA-methyltransferase (adenine-specific) n=1 Tax=Marinilabilia salmonicolor TaxID=989 RepID=A0A368UR86_9BACT|nr:TaqI-like C-terminal specificity domain-containing protein [Marinilabilia salmonicolor]RCW31306.1 type II restriction/modification system DNA methylase subunit YeeA [Marinilabilia salmonicolor]